MSLAMSAGIPQSSRVPVTAFVYDTWTFELVHMELVVWLGICSWM